MKQGVVSHLEIYMNFYNFHSMIGWTRYQSKCLIDLYQFRLAFAFRRSGEIHGAKVVEKMV